MKRLLTLALLSLSFAALGCPGSLDPSLEGGGGSMGTAGSGGGGTSGGAPCDAPNMVLKSKCGSVICHDPSNLSSNAGLDFTKTTGYVAELLGQTSQGINGSSCGGNTTPYLMSGSSPASGLMIDKISNQSPACGFQMPYGMPALGSADMACVKSWALGITTGVITQ